MHIIDLMTANVVSFRAGGQGRCINNALLGLGKLLSPFWLKIGLLVKVTICYIFIQARSWGGEGVRGVPPRSTMVHKGPQLGTSFCQVTNWNGIELDQNVWKCIIFNHNFQNFSGALPSPSPPGLANQGWMMDLGKEGVKHLQKYLSFSCNVISI